MKENSDGNDTNVGSIGNSIEEDNWDTKKYIESEIEQDMIRESKILNKRIRELIK